MNLSYNWLKQYLDIDDYTVEEVCEQMTLAGLEVETINYLAQADNLVVGQILSVEDHPEADSLKVCQVDIGEELVQIVCGAKNVARNQKVIVAKEGAKLPQLKIKKTTIRNVASNGMICSLNELGVDEKHLTEKQLSGIEVLSDDAVVGNDKVMEFLGLDDVIIEIDLTPNRSDCLSMFNMAKEVGAILNKKVKLPNINNHKNGRETKVKAKIETKNSQRLGVKLIGQVTIKPSVAWMRKILLSNGIKPINNVVDISNIVMLELGQPLHFYDVNQLKTLELVVSDGFNESFTALDEESYQISKDDLVITSNKEIIGIAGIMGGSDSKITDSTKSILIESAHFDYATIRTSARRLNITSEASTRFSKGIDPNALDMAINRAVDLLIKYADAKDIEETLIVGSQNLEKKNIVTTPKYINGLLGTNYLLEEIKEVFERLDFNPLVVDDKISVSIPTYRRDIEGQVDLSEEVIRIIGIDTLDSTLPYVKMSPGGISDSDHQQNILNQALRGGGFNEVITYSLVSKENIDLAIMPIGPAVEIANPISKDRKYYRTSLIPSLLEILHYNEARNNDEYSLYEIADVYSDGGKQEERLSIAISYKHEISAWQNITHNNSFFSIKGIILSILAKMGIAQERIDIKSNQLDDKIFHPYQSGMVYIDKELFGVMGLVHPNIQKCYDINQAVLGEFNLQLLYKKKKSKVKYIEISRYPGISRDIAVIIPEELEAKKIIDTVKKIGEPLVVDVNVFDVYQGKNMEKGFKSLALRIYYQSFEKTLKDSDVNDLHKKIVKALIKKHNVIYREK